MRPPDEVKLELARHQIDFPKTHDLENLLNLVALADEKLAGSLRDITILTDYSVDIRYPGDIPEMTSEEAQWNLPAKFGNLFFSPLLNIWSSRSQLGGMESGKN